MSCENNDRSIVLFNKWIIVFENRTNLSYLEPVVELFFLQIPLLKILEMRPDIASAPAFSIFGGIWSTPVAFFDLRGFIIFQSLRSTDRFKIIIAISLFGTIFFIGLNTRMCGRRIW